VHTAHHQAFSERHRRHSGMIRRYIHTMFASITLDGGPTVPARLLEVLTAAVLAVDPRRAVRSALRRDGRTLIVDGHTLPLPEGRIIVLAVGKAAVGMAWGAADALGDLEITGVAATPDPSRGPSGITVVEGSHPIPDHRSVQAGTRLLAAAQSAGPDDLVLALVSGGGSACAEVPSTGLAVTDLAGTTGALLRSGAPIEEINTVRRALSALKGGGLARAAAPALLVTLVLSDVVGNHLPTIAGGPTVADPTGPAEALAVIDGHGLALEVAPAVLAHLQAAPTAPQPHVENPVVIVADASTAAEGALAAAVGLGIPARVMDTAVTGEAREVGGRLAASVAGQRSPSMSIYAGETTVTVTGDGWGGRNQEVALAAGIVLDGEHGSVIASLGTDGIDGPTPAAGGIADGGTVARGRVVGLDASASLAANDSGTYLGAVGGRLVSGPTGTNVGDVMVAWRFR